MWNRGRKAFLVQSNLSKLHSDSFYIGPSYTSLRWWIYLLGKTRRFGSGVIWWFLVSISFTWGSETGRQDPQSTPPFLRHQYKSPSSGGNVLSEGEAAMHGRQPPSQPASPTLARGQSLPSSHPGKHSILAILTLALLLPSIVVAKSKLR